MAQESERSNIVLIGMPGAGKSTLGIVLAKILNYNFIDADLVIQNQCDKTLQKLIDACGPEGFIQVENQILSDLTAERSIIATGGSAVYSDEAMKHLSGIGRIVYLQISYDELKRRLHDLQESRSTNGMPRSPSMWTTCPSPLPPARWPTPCASGSRRSLRPASRAQDDRVRRFRPALAATAKLDDSPGTERSRPLCRRCWPSRC